MVTAVGEGVTDLAVGDHVVSLFFPDWQEGPPGPGEGNFARVPGDGIDGYAREEVTAPATAFTRAHVIDADAIGEVPRPLSPVGRIQGLIVGSRRHQLEMIRAIDAAGLQPVIDSTYPLDGLADAFRHQESHRHFGKICVEC